MDSSFKNIPAIKNIIKKKKIFLTSTKTGLSWPQFVPSFLDPMVRVVEWILKPFNKWIGMFVYIELKKV